MTKPPSTPARKSRPPAPRANRARAMADLLPNVGGAAFRKFGFLQHSIVSRWNEIVGPRYAGVSIPESIRFPPGKRAEGVLSLVVGSAHAPMMQHIAPEIIERVNRFFGYAAIARLTFRHGEVKRAPKRAAPPPPKPIPKEMGDSLRDIGDPELKAVLEALAASVIASDDKRKLNALV